MEGIIKKIFVIVFISIIFTSFFISGNLAWANSVQDLMDKAAGSALYDVSKTDPTFFVGTIIKTFLSLLGVFFVCLAVYGGFMWMSAQGDADRVKKARDILRDAVIGLIIVIAAYAIAYFVLYYVAQNFIQGGF